MKLEYKNGKYLKDGIEIDKLTFNIEYNKIQNNITINNNVFDEDE